MDQAPPLQSPDQARLSVFRDIETFYSPRRRFSSLGGISPDEYKQRFGAGDKIERLIQQRQQEQPNPVVL